MTFVGVDKGTNGSDGSRRARGEENTSALSGGAVGVDADGIAVDALEYDGTAAAEVGDSGRVGFYVPGRTAVEDGLAG